MCIMEAIKKSNCWPGTERIKDAKHVTHVPMLMIELSNIKYIIHIHIHRYSSVRSNIDKMSRHKTCAIYIE